MKLEINTNGAWRTVLRGLTSADLPHVQGAAVALCDVAYCRDRQRIKFRLTGENGEVLLHIDSTDCVWVDGL